MTAELACLFVVSIHRVTTTAGRQILLWDHSITETAECQAKLHNLSSAAESSTFSGTFYNYAKGPMKYLKRPESWKLLIGH